jgi:PAS domain S-box-containing protein
VQVRTPSVVLRFGIAIVAVATALLLKLLLAPLIERESPFTFFLAAVMLAAWYGGFRAGLLATAVAVPVIDFFFLEPVFTFDFGVASGNSLSLILFLGEGSVISVLVGWLHSAQNAARARTRELAASEARYRRIVETTHEGVWIRDAEQRTDYVNPRMAEMLGYMVEEMLGRTWDDFIHPSDMVAADHFWERRQQGITEQYEFRFCRKDGTELWAIVSTNPIYNYEGGFRGALAMLTDVTPRKYAEEELRRAKNELEIKVVERTAELSTANARLEVELGERRRAEEELRLAKEAAEAANQAKNDFLATVSHEIRNPMNIILVTTDLLRETELTAKQAEYLQMMRSSALSLLSVVNDLLDLSKIEAGRLTLDSVPFNLSDGLAKVLKGHAFRAHQKGLELACYIDPAIPEILIGDPNRLSQIVDNLVGNAVKFTEQGEVVVRVEMTFRDADEVELHGVVTDTGIGIPADKLEAIFRPFVQADSSTTRRFGGTGLGLAIAAKLVALVGGRIWVESVVGRGSAFHIVLRFRQSQSLAMGIVEAKLANLTDLPILVVDDNATQRGILVETLRNWRMRPAAACGAAEAMEALNRARECGEPFSVILLDAQIPGTDVSALIAKMSPGPDVNGAIILMTSPTFAPAELTHCRDLGVRAALSKPIVPSELRATLLTIREPGEATNKTSPPSLAASRALRILVVEDNPINQVLMMDLLEKLGHEVVTASSGVEALAALEKKPCQAVLMDVQVLEMSGFEVATRIREREKATGTRVPIVAVTAYAMKGDRERCLQAGMDAYLAKPFQAQELIKTLAQVAPPA